MKNIEALIADGGEKIMLGALYPIKCAATAANTSSTLAMLVHRNCGTD